MYRYAYRHAAGIGTGMGIRICICVVMRMGMCVDTCIDMCGWVWLALVSQPSILGSLAQPQNEGTWSPTKSTAETKKKTQTLKGSSVQEPG